MEFLVKNEIVVVDQSHWDWNLRIFGRKRAINEVKKDIILQFKIHHKARISFADIKIVK